MDVSSLPGFIEEIEISKIHPSGRALRSDLGFLDGLMASIEEKGLLEPIVVRPVEDGFEVIAGNRRYEACKRLGIKRIPCHVVELDDKEAFEVSLIENIQRKTMNPIDEATAFKKYVDDYGYGGISELARKIGKSQEYVSRRIQLLRLPRKVKEEIMHGRITPSIAQELLSLDDEDASEFVIHITEQHLSMREVRRIVRYHRYGHRSNVVSSSFPYTLNTYRINSGDERRIHRIERAFDRCITSLRISLYRLSDAIHDVEDEWTVWEILMEYRGLVNRQIDDLLKLKRKIQRYRRL